MATPITCHVLDTLTGRPAHGVHTTLTLLVPLGPDPAPPYTGTTDADGRIKSWANNNSGPPLAEIYGASKKHNEHMVWELKFVTAPYFGPNNTFWPEVVLRFLVDPKEDHYHVPLLLGPWSYTTYRGS